MDQFNKTTWMTNSTFQQSVLNNSSNFTTDAMSRNVQYNIVFLSVILLGLPGNVLVIAMYITKMSTSTRVYLFALAVSDTVICLSAIAQTLAITNYVIALANYLVTIVLLLFSILLLVFVSVERLIAVRRPHTFDMNPTRAKIHLTVLLACAILISTGSKFANSQKSIQFVAIFLASLLIGSSVIMLVCYTLIAMTLLKKAMTFRNQVAAITSQISSHSSNPPNTNVTFVTGRSEASTSVTAVTKIISKQKQNAKSILLLFIVTIVFVACWLPVLLQSLGYSLTREVRRIYVINSVVNPFIYGVASAMFREDVRQFFHQTRDKLSACYNCMCGFVC